MRIAVARSVATSWFPYRDGLPFAQGFPRSNDSRLGTLRANHAQAGNSGNLIISEALGRILGGERGTATSSYVELSRLRDSGWSAAEIAAYVDEHFDLVVFPMANHVRPGARLGHLVDIVEALRTDFAVFGLGLQNQLAADISALDSGTTKLFELFNERAKVFGVRGEATEKWFSSVGLLNAQALGCPSLYVYPRNILGIKAPPKLTRGTIMTAGHIHQRAERSTALYRILAGWDARYVMQDELFHLPRLLENDDFYNDATGQLDKETIEFSLSVIHHRRAPFRDYWYFQDVEPWRVFASQQSAYVGDRFHGAVAALQAGVPALVLGEDLRVAELCAYFGIPYRATTDARRLTLPDLVQTALSDDALATFQARYADRLAGFQKALSLIGVPEARSSEIPQGGGLTDARSKSGVSLRARRTVRAGLTRAANRIGRVRGT